MGQGPSQGPGSPRRQYEEPGAFTAELGGEPLQRQHFERTPLLSLGSSGNVGSTQLSPLNGLRFSGSMQQQAVAEGLRTASLVTTSGAVPSTVAVSTQFTALVSDRTLTRRTPYCRPKSVIYLHDLQAAPTTAVAASTLSPLAPVTAAPAASLATVPQALPAGTQASQPAQQLVQQPQQRSTSHKSTALIPGWSRALSSQALQLECQKAHQPQRISSAQDTYGVLELEVMKYVAYCGGITVKFRVDDLHYGPVDNISWGLASTRACPALQAPAQPAVQQPTPQPAAVAASSPGPAGGTLATGAPPADGANPDTAEAPPTSTTPAPPAAPSSPSGAQSGSGGSVATPDAAASTASPSASSKGRRVCAAPGATNAQAAAPAAAGAPAKPPSAPAVAVDSVSRKPLYMISSTSTHRTVEPGDVLSLELAPREDKQPVIMATLKLNDCVLLQSSLPCSIISSLQMYPFVTVQPGMSVSLHEATTPSPLFTWYSPTVNGAPETQLCELDTCVKYHTAATTPANLSPLGYGASVDFHGSTVFTSGRHRWTVQLDNYGPHPTHIYVGIVTSSLEAPTANGSNILASFGGPLRALTGGAAASSSGASGFGGGGRALAADGTGPSGSGSVAGPSGAVGSGAQAGADAAPSVPRPQGKWGAWMRLPGAWGLGHLGRHRLRGPSRVVLLGVERSKRTWITKDLASQRLWCPAIEFVWVPMARCARGQGASANLHLPQRRMTPCHPCAAGTNAVSNASPSPLNVPPPPRDGLAHMAESSSAHCFITVDLDLNAGYVRFFRNGHLIVSAFTGVTAPVSPAIAFVQAPGLHCQVRVGRALAVGWAGMGSWCSSTGIELQPCCGWEFSQQVLATSVRMCGAANGRQSAAP